MSKICIIGNSNIKHISLISLYTKYFDEHSISYDIIYIDRYGEKEYSTAQKSYAFPTGILDNKFKKIIMFYRFRKYVKSIIRANEYSLIITWQATTAYILFDVLCMRFKGRFVMNIRDYIMENNPIIKMILKILLKNDAFTTISSHGFLHFLPKHDYIMVNSINEAILTGQRSNNKRCYKKRDPIKVGFVGNCRFFDECYKLIDALGNDRRFQIWYCGTNSDVLKNYAISKGIENVFTIGAFSPEKTTEIMSNFDIINSAFGNTQLDVKMLMPIRLYTAMSIQIPVLVNARTYQANIVSDNKLGYVIDSYSGLNDRLYEYMNQLDFSQFALSCDKYLQCARNENEIFYSCLKKQIEHIV